MSVALGDLNGDGKLDMAVASQRDNNVAIFLVSTPVPTCSPTPTATATVISTNCSDWRCPPSATSFTRESNTN